jgi:hypothetical protein
MEIVITGILTLLTIGVGIWKFSAQQKQANRRPFLQKQLDLCFQATETTGRLASESDPIEWEKARITFWRLYWGPLSVVEGRLVEKAMVELGKLVPDNPVSSSTLPMKSLEVPSYELAHAVRGLVLPKWNVRLRPLQGLRRKQAQIDKSSGGRSKT